MKPPRAYSVDGRDFVDECTFLYLNQDDPELCAAVVGLEPGEPLLWGGGAAAEFVIEARVGT